MCPASVHQLTAQEADVVVVADGGQLVLVPANQAHGLVADHILAQLLQRVSGKRSARHCTLLGSAQNL